MFKVGDVIQHKESGTLYTVVLTDVNNYAIVYSHLDKLQYKILSHRFNGYELVKRNKRYPFKTYRRNLP